MRPGNRPKTERAQDLRAIDNEAEAALWQELRGRRLNGHKFVRQWRVGPFFADFACRQSNLVVEVDGSQHVAAWSYDMNRNLTMNTNGWAVLRFWHIDVLKQRRGVCDTILAALDGRLSTKTIAPDLKFFPAQGN